MRIYLDHSASSPLRPEAREAMLSVLREPSANASSVHAAGHRARMAVEEGRGRVAALVGARPDEIVLTGGGSEANNLALFGAAAGAPPGRRRVVTSSFEHPSVLGVMDDLESRGFEVARVAPGRDGLVRPEAILAAVDETTCLVSLMLANNEVGTLQPVGLIATALRGLDLILHTDAAQAAGKIPLDAGALGIDLMTLAAHKLGGPQGAGALFVRQGLRLHPHLRGGGQERNRRPGTENVAAIAGFGAAAAATGAHLDEESRRIGALRDRLERDVLAAIQDTRVNAASSPRVPGLSSLAIAGTSGEALVIGLDLEGIAVSAGSACSAGTIKRSASLLAMGLGEEAACSIRISLGPDTRPDEIDILVDRLAAVAGQIRAAAPVAQVPA